VVTFPASISARAVASPRRSSAPAPNRRQRLRPGRQSQTASTPLSWWASLGAQLSAKTEGDAMLTDFTIDGPSVGQIIGPENGYVVSLSRARSTATGPREMAQFDQGRQIWRSGRLVLRASRESRNLFCVDTDSGPGWATWRGDVAVVTENSSIGFRGNLKVVCVQRGSIWNLTLSDVPFDTGLPKRTSFGPHENNNADGVWGNKS
jgi:hypothetical protein